MLPRLFERSFEVIIQQLLKKGNVFEIYGLLDYLPIPQSIKKALKEKVAMPIFSTGMVSNLDICDLRYQMDEEFFKALKSDKKCEISYLADGCLKAIFHDSKQFDFSKTMPFDILLQKSQNKSYHSKQGIKIITHNEFCGILDLVEKLQSKGIPITRTNIKTAKAKIKIVSMHDPQKSRPKQIHLPYNFVNAQYQCEIDLLKSPKRFDTSSFLQNIHRFRKNDISCSVILHNKCDFKKHGRSTYQILLEKHFDEM